MAHPGFGPLWQQAEMSDVDIVISVADGVTAHDQDHQAHRHNVLQQFPGHSLILSLCPYLKVQASADPLHLCTLMTAITCWYATLYSIVSGQSAARGLPITRTCLSLLLSHSHTCAAVAATEQQPCSHGRQRSRQKHQATGKAAGHYHTAKLMP
jgi:hypothetical protein